MNIYLTGYRCTGKTTIGRALAHQLGWDFIDMDDRIVADQGVSIAQMVDRHGWDYFRQKERALVQQISRMQGRVVGTGGGVILNKDNVAAIRDSGKVVWLRCKPETIRRLIVADQRSDEMRPALTDQGLLEEIEDVLAEREPLYREAMDLVVDTDQFDVSRLCDQIVDGIRQLGVELE